MIGRLNAAALPWPVMSRAVRIAAMVVSVALPAVATAGAPAQSWNGYRWGRTGPVTIAVGSDYSAAWKPFVATAIGQWNVATNVDYAAVAGRSAPAACAAVYGTIQVCSGNYGRTNWVGYTNVATSNGYIVQATIRLNDYYFSQSRYNTAAWRAETICQELGNALGLQDSDHNTGNANTGSCMDYSRDPSGTFRTNGTLANIRPSASDLKNLNAIYAVPGGKQVGGTSTRGFASPNGAVPEPASWALMVAGFGLVGTAARRQRTVIA